MYDGTDLINDAGGDVVVVVVQYRLAFFGGYHACNWSVLDVHHLIGFLGGSEVKQKGALNAGLRKQHQLRSNMPSDAAF